MFILDKIIPHFFAAGIIFKLNLQNCQHFFFFFLPLHSFSSLFSPTFFCIFLPIHALCPATDPCWIFCFCNRLNFPPNPRGFVPLYCNGSSTCTCYDPLAIKAADTSFFVPASYGVTSHVTTSNPYKAITGSWPQKSWLLARKELVAGRVEYI